MIMIGRINYPDSVFSGVEFNISYRVWYLIFPITPIFTKVYKEGNLILNQTKKPWFFFGCYRVELESKINKDTNFKIEVGK